MSDRKPTVVPLFGGVFLLIAMYFGAYYGMCVPVPSPATMEWRPAYRYWPGKFASAFGNEALAKVFAPIHSLDRRMRPHVWDGPVPIWQ